MIEAVLCGEQIDLHAADGIRDRLVYRWDVAAATAAILSLMTVFSLCLAHDGL